MNIRSTPWLQCLVILELRTDYMQPTIAFHCTYITSESGSENFILNNDQGTVQEHMEICVTLQGNASLDHH